MDHLGKAVQFGVQTLTKHNDGTYSATVAFYDSKKKIVSAPYPNPHSALREVVEKCEKEKAMERSQLKGRLMKAQTDQKRESSKTGKELVAKLVKQLGDFNSKHGYLLD